MAQISKLSKINKQVLYDVLYDINEDAQKPEVVYETYKNDVEDDPDRNLITWMVYDASDEPNIMKWYEKQYENKNTFVDRIIKNIGYLNKEEKQIVLNVLKKEID